MESRKTARSDMSLGVPQGMHGPPDFSSVLIDMHSLSQSLPFLDKTQTPKVRKSKCPLLFGGLMMHVMIALFNKGKTLLAWPRTEGRSG